MTYSVSKTDDEWKKELSPEEFDVLRKKGTERPFSGEYDNHFEEGQYVCRACGQVVFDSVRKYDAGCGWPSFDEAISGSVERHEDTSHGMHRVEVTCSSCGGHLGHVFPDGPRDTTGERYCINSVSLKFVPDKQQ